MSYLICFLQLSLQLFLPLLLLLFHPCILLFALHLHFQVLLKHTKLVNSKAWAVTLISIYSLSSTWMMSIISKSGSLLSVSPCWVTELGSSSSALCSLWLLWLELLLLLWLVWFSLFWLFWLFSRCSRLRIFSSWCTELFPSVFRRMAVCIASVHTESQTGWSKHCIVNILGKLCLSYNTMWTSLNLKFNI